jgi:hypothetical protein
MIVLFFSSIILNEFSSFVVGTEATYVCEQDRRICPEMLNAPFSQGTRQKYVNHGKHVPCTSTHL